MSQGWRRAARPTDLGGEAPPGHTEERTACAGTPPHSAREWAMDLRAVGEVLEEVDRHADTDDACMVLGVLGHGFPCFLKKHYSM